MAQDRACGDPVRLARYRRQLPLLGVEGQRRLSRAKVAVVGAGGLGTITSMYLAAAGVGEIRIIDPDQVEEDNLNRQLLYDTPSIGLPKAYIAARRLKEINPCVNVVPFREKVDEGTVDVLLDGVDLIVDGLDNWEGRLVLDDYAHKTRTPIVHAAVEAYYGQVLLVVPGETACLRCIAPRRPGRQCVSVVGAMVGVVATIQASIAVRFLAGDPLEAGTLYVIDMKNMEINKIPLAPNACKCPQVKQQDVQANGS